MSCSFNNVKYTIPPAAANGTSAARIRKTILSVIRTTFNACAAANRNADLAFKVTPCFKPSPIAIRQEVSTAVIAMIKAPPRINVTIPAGVVKKNNAMSTSAMTRSDVPERSQYNSQVVAGIRIAKAISLYARSVIAMLRQVRRRSPKAMEKIDWIEFDIGWLRIGTIDGKGKRKADILPAQRN